MEHNIHFITAEFSALNAIEAQCMKDKIYISFSNDVEQCVSEFERAKDWTDLVSCLQQQLKILEGSKYQSKYKFLPQGLVAGLTRVLAQSMQLGLPPGVHSKALRVYRVQQTRLGVEFFIRDLSFLSNGLLPALQYGTEGIRLEQLVMIDQFYMPLGQKLGSISVSLLSGLLSCIEDPSSALCRETVLLLDRLKECLGSVLYFTSCLEVVKASPGLTVPVLEHLLKFRADYTVPSGDSEIRALEYPEDTQNLLVDTLICAISSKDDMRGKAALSLLPDFFPLICAMAPSAPGSYPMVLARSAQLRLLAAIFPLLMSNDIGLQRRAAVWLSAVVDQDRQLSEHAAGLLSQLIQEALDAVLSTAVQARQFLVTGWALDHFACPEKWQRNDIQPLLLASIPQAVSYRDAESVVLFQHRAVTAIKRLGTLLTVLNSQTVFDYQQILDRHAISLAVVEYVLPALQTLSMHLLKRAQDALILQSRLTESSSQMSVDGSGRDVLDQIFEGISGPEHVAIVNYVEGSSLLLNNASSVGDSNRSDPSVEEQLLAYIVTDAPSTVAKDTRRVIRQQLPNARCVTTCYPHVFTEIKEAHQALITSLSTYPLSGHVALLTKLSVDDYNQTVFNVVQRNSAELLNSAIADGSMVQSRLAQQASIHGRTDEPLDQSVIEQVVLEKPGLRTSLLLSALSVRSCPDLTTLFQRYITKVTVDSLAHAITLLYCSWSFGTGFEILQSQLAAYPAVLAASLQSHIPSEEQIVDEHFFSVLCSLNEANLASTLVNVALKHDWVHHLRPSCQVATALVQCITQSFRVPVVKLNNTSNDIYFACLTPLEANTPAARNMAAVEYILTNKALVASLQSTILDPSLIAEWVVESAPTDGFLLPFTLRTVEDFCLLSVAAASTSILNISLLTKAVSVSLVVDPLRSSIQATIPLPPSVPIVQARVVSRCKLIGVQSDEDNSATSRTECTLHDNSPVSLADVLAVRLLLANEPCFNTCLQVFVLSQRDITPFLPLSSCASSIQIIPQSDNVASLENSCGYDRHVAGAIYTFETLLRAKSVDPAQLCRLFPLTMPYTHLVLPMLQEHAIQTRLFSLVVSILQFSIVITGDLGDTCCGAHSPTPLSTVPHPAKVDTQFTKLLTDTVRLRAEADLPTLNHNFYNISLLDTAGACQCKKLLESPKTALSGALTLLTRHDLMTSTDSFIVPSSLPMESAVPFHPSSVVAGAQAQFLADLPVSVLSQLGFDSKQGDLLVAACPLFSSAPLLPSSARLPYSPSTIRSQLFSFVPPAQTGILGWLSTSATPSVTPVSTLCWCHRRAPILRAHEYLIAAIMAVFPTVLPFVSSEPALQSVFAQLARIFPVRILSETAKLWPLKEKFSLHQRNIILTLCHALGPFHVLKFALQAVQTLASGLDEYTMLPLTQSSSNTAFSMDSHGYLHADRAGDIKGQNTGTDTVVPCFALPGTSTINAAIIDIPKQYPALFAILTYTLLLLDTICAHHAFPTASCPIPSNHPLLLLSDTETEQLAKDVGATSWGMLCLLGFVPVLTDTLTGLSTGSKKPSPLTLYLYSQCLPQALTCHQSLSKRIVTVTLSFLPLKLLYQQIRSETPASQTTCWPSCAALHNCFSKDCCHGILHSSTRAVQCMKPGSSMQRGKSGSVQSLKLEMNGDNLVTQMLTCGISILTPASVSVLRPQLLNVLHSMLNTIVPFTNQLLPWITGDQCRLIDLVPSTAYLTLKIPCIEASHADPATTYTSLTLVLLRCFTRVMAVLIDNYIIPCAPQHFPRSVMLKPISAISKTLSLAVTGSSSSCTVLDIAADVDPYLSTISDHHTFTVQNLCKQSIPALLQCFNALPVYPHAAPYREYVATHWLEICHFISVMHIPSFFTLVGSAMKPYILQMLKVGGCTQLPVSALKMLMPAISTTLNNAIPPTPVYSLQGYYHADREHDKKQMSGGHVLQGKSSTPNLDLTQQAAFCRSLSLQLLSAKDVSPVSGVGVLERVSQAVRVPITNTTSELDNPHILLHSEGMLLFRVAMLRMPKNRWSSVLPTVVSTVLSHFHCLVGVTLQDTLSQISGTATPSLRIHSKTFLKLVLQDIHVLLECAMHNSDALLPLREFFAASHVKYAQHPIFDKTSSTENMDPAIVTHYRQTYIQESLNARASLPSIAVLFIALQEALSLPHNAVSAEISDTYSLLRHPEVYNDKWSSQITLDWNSPVSNPLTLFLHQVLHNRPSNATTIEDLILHAFTEI